MNVKPVFHVSFSIVALLITFYAVGKFMFFLSEPQFDIRSEEKSVVKSLLINQFLLTCFVFQHTFMALPDVKNLLSKWGLDVICRSIYIFMSSFLLLVLMNYWQTITSVTLWYYDMSNWKTWFFFVSIHTFSWSAIYTGCLFMDISELLGVKQVYYSLRKMPNPIKYKSDELKKLFGHTRHPSFTILLFILWFIPIMTLDRLILASLLTVYMYLMWATDKYDLNYQQTQYYKKVEELHNIR